MKKYHKIIIGIFALASILGGILAYETFSPPQLKITCEEIPSYPVLVAADFVSIINVTQSSLGYARVCGYQGNA